MEEYYQRIGVILVVLAIGSILLKLVGMQILILFWMDQMGDVVGWILRVLLLVAGCVLVKKGE